MIRARTMRGLAVLFMVVGAVFAAAPAASAAPDWVAIYGVDMERMSTAADDRGLCTENTFARACFARTSAPEVFFAKDREEDGFSAGVLVHVLNTGRVFGCYHPFGVGNFGKCTANIGEGNTVCIYALVWNRSAAGQPPLYDRNTRVCGTA